MITKSNDDNNTNSFRLLYIICPADDGISAYAPIASKNVYYTKTIIVPDNVVNSSLLTGRILLDLAFTKLMVEKHNRKIIFMTTDFA